MAAIDQYIFSLKAARDCLWKVTRLVKKLNTITTGIVANRLCHGLLISLITQTATTPSQVLFALSIRQVFLHWHSGTVLPLGSAMRKPAMEFSCLVLSVSRGNMLPMALLVPRWYTVLLRMGSDQFVVHMEFLVPVIVNTPKVSLLALMPDFVWTELVLSNVFPNIKK